MRSSNDALEQESPLAKMQMHNVEEHQHAQHPHHIIAAAPGHYYYAAPPPQGYAPAPGSHPHHPQGFIPYQPYVLYPHPSAFQPTHECPEDGPCNMPGGHSSASGGKTMPSTGNNSALHLPPLPFAFAQHEGSGSSHSLSHGDGQGMPRTGSTTMFAGKPNLD